MKCTVCDVVNISKANYCKNCGNRFTRRQKEQAEKFSALNVMKTADDVSKKVKKAKKIVTGKIITGNTYFRIAVLIVPFIVNLFLRGGNNSLHIAAGDDYTVYYNTKTREYFLEMEKDTVNLNLYVPADTECVTVTYSGGGSNTYGTDDNITIEVTEHGYYSVQAQTADSSESLVLYTVKGGSDNG